MNQLTTFNFGTTQVRTARTELGDPLFCLADICKCLEITQPSNVVTQVCEEFCDSCLTKVTFLDMLGRSQEYLCLTEPQLYFVMMRSRSEHARSFRQWICNEVLPSIHKTGAIEVLPMLKQDAMPIVINHDGKLVVSSRNVAAVFGKRHDHVLEDIRNTIANCSEDFRLPNFGESTYLNSQNHEMPEYLLTKDGLTMLVMGYTGQKAMRFKEAYIKRFNEMEAQLNGQFKQDVDIEKMLVCAKLVLEPAGITGNQLSLALDKAYKAETGKSLLALTGTQLVAPEQSTLRTPTEIGQMFNLTPHKVNLLFEAYGLQVKLCGKWELTELGRQHGGVLLDVNKAHTDGTPVQQIKWDSRVLDFLKSKLDNHE